MPECHGEPVRERKRWIGVIAAVTEFVQELHGEVALRGGDKQIDVVVRSLAWLVQATRQVDSLERHEFELMGTCADCQLLEAAVE